MSRLVWSAYMPISVKKLDGTVEPYKPSKLRRSLRKSGAGKETIDHILKKVEKMLFDGIETKMLYDFVMKELKKHEPIVSCKYDIKEALLQLGKPGRYFEQFIGELLERRGFSIKLNKVVMGEHVTHEIDVIARKDTQVWMVECKHHMKPWLGLHIQTALYVYARFLDVKDTFTKPLLVTNTTFSEHAVKYARGAGLQLMGWSYPRKDSLQDNIEKFKLYPITLFKPLGEKNIKKCMEAKMVSVQDFLHAKPKRLAKVLGESEKRVKSYLSMAESLCA